MLCIILKITPAEQTTYIIKLPTSHTFGFNQKDLKAKKILIRLTAAKIKTPITVSASVKDGVYSTFLPVCLFKYSSNLCVVTCPSVCVMVHLNFFRKLSRSSFDKIAVLG